MSFRAEFNDITKFEGDAIVNSLGYYSPTIFGKICKSIVSKAKSRELLDVILSDGMRNDRKYGDYFITSGYELKAKNIINIYPPYKEYDLDFNLDKLTALFIKIIEIAKKNGYKTLGIPYIGCGGNGYEPSDPYIAMNRAIKNYLKDETIDIAFIMYDARKEANKNEDSIFKGSCNGMPLERYDKEDGLSIGGAPHLGYMTAGKSTNSPKKATTGGSIPNNDYMKCLKAFDYFLKDEIYIKNLKKYANPYKYFHDILMKNDDDASHIAEYSCGLYDKTRLSRLNTGKNKLTMIDIIDLSIMQGLSAKEICTWMLISGFTFNANDEIHMAFLNELYEHGGFSGQDDAKYGNDSALYIFSLNIKNDKKKNELFRNEEIRKKHENYSQEF